MPRDPIQIQVAFQGGGAKLAALLAAAEALEQAEADGKIKITRLAGTSAGSIAACFLAAGVPMNTVRQSLLGQGPTMVKYYSAIGVWDVLQALRGSPIKKTKMIEDWIKGLLLPKKVVSVGDVAAVRGVQFLAPATDLGSRKPFPARDDQDVVQALMDSCGLPFFFRTWARSGSTIVDGGLCENLPTDLLAEGVEQYGKVLGDNHLAHPCI